MARRQKLKSDVPTHVTSGTSMLRDYLLFEQSENDPPFRAMSPAEVRQFVRHAALVASQFSLFLSRAPRLHASLILFIYLFYFILFYPHFFFLRAQERAAVPRHGTRRGSSVVCTTPRSSHRSSVPSSW